MSKDYRRYQRILTYQMQSAVRKELERKKEIFVESNPYVRIPSHSIVMTESSGSTDYPTT